MKHKVAKGKFIIEDSDGNTTELGFVMPSKIATEIFKQILDWRKNWYASFEDAAGYEQAEKEFIESKNLSQ